MAALTSWYARYKNWLIFCLVSTFLWGLAAHGYGFFNSNFTLDSLNELHAGVFGNNLRMFSGRYFVPLYRDLVRSDVTLPWLIGLLSLLWAGLAVFLVQQIFQVESKGIVFLMAGVFVTNATFSSTAATYIHDLDCFMVSLLCAAGAVYLWKVLPRGWLLGVPLITVSLAMYQSFVFTAATLVMLVSILELMNGGQFQPVFFKGLRAVGMVMLGGILYFIGLKTIVPLSGVQLSSGYYNSMDLILLIRPEQIGGLVLQTYRDWFARLWEMGSTYPSILVRLMQLCVLALCGGVLLIWFCSKSSGWKEKLLCLVLVLLLPLVMNLLNLLTMGMNHDLMVFAIWMIYLMALLLADWLAKQWKAGKLLLRLGQWQRAGCLLLVAVLMYGNVQFANGMHLKKDLECDAYLSLMTRVAARMEQQPDYIPGETPVVFVGLPDVMNQVMPGFKDYWNATGLEFSDVIYAPEKTRFQAYFDYVLGMPLLLAEDEVWYAVQRAERENLTPAYPSSDFLRMQEGVLIVKLGKTWE